MKSRPQPRQAYRWRPHGSRPSRFVAGRWQDGQVNIQPALYQHHLTSRTHFEEAGFRHLGLDAAQLRFPFPQYGRWAPVPDEVVDAMIAAYRDALARAWPPARDDGAFAAVLVVGCAAWVLIRTYRLPLVCDEHQWPADAQRRRAQLLHMIDTFLAVAERAGRFAGLVAWYRDLGRAMRRRWPDVERATRGFPAFASVDN